MKKRIICLMLLVVPMAMANAQRGDGFYRMQTQVSMREGNVGRAVMLYSQWVDLAKESRNAGKGVSGDLLAEYAYALALHHDFEAALINIDRAMALKASNGTFFAGQILTVMDYDMAAFQLSGYVPGQYYKVSKYSDWLNGTFPSLTDKYRSKATINRDSPQEALKRAAALADQEQVVQAIALYEELMEQYPNAYIIPASYSTLWEKHGNRVYAATLLKRSIELMGSENHDERVAFVEHVKKLEAVTPVGFSRLTKGMQMIVYTGASFGKGMSSLNGRVGVSTESKFSTSLNANLMIWNKTLFGTIGLSAYKTWSFFVIGIGVSKQFSKTSGAWGLAPSVGLTFINKAQTASFDITAAGQIPFASETRYSYSLSIGTTFYLDFKSKMR